MRKPEIHWATDWGNNRVGNAYGYWNMSTSLLEELKNKAVITDKANDAIVILSPEFYTFRLENKVNWLLTMFEGSVPDKYVENLKRPDHLIVPSIYVKNLFEKYVDTPCHVMPLGVSRFYTYKKRKLPKSRPFRFLWVGAPNPRKGWEEVISVWKYSGMDTRPDFELVIKTTRVTGAKRIGNVILDGRNLPKKNLLELYHSSHCFLFPTRGEGFGLTLSEAMATGLPCIATNYSGHTDFFDDKVGYPIGYKFGTSEIEERYQKEKDASKNIKYKIKVAYPNVEELLDRMIHVVTNYDEALKKGAKASRRIKSRFTWQMSAQRLVDAIKENQNGTVH